MKKQYLNVNKVLDVEKLEGGEQGIYLDEGQVSAIDQRLAADAESLQAAITEKGNAVTEKEAAETGLNDAVAAFDAIDESVAKAGTPQEKADAVRALLAAKPGTQPAGVLEGQDPVPGGDKDVDWDAINNSELGKLAKQI